MTLQNRVSPFGRIESNPARGLMMGNRGGRMHDASTRTLTTCRWASKRWIVCVTEFRGRHRQVMSPNSYTELFFLDEVTALAAGHRPCFECRNADAKSYAAAFPGGPMRADDMDDRLHRERCVSGGRSIAITRKEVETLPTGAMFASDTDCFAVGANGCSQWRFDGYRQLSQREHESLLAGGKLVLLTPPSTIAALRNGYRPQFHPSANA
ncbi:hypothetical protein [Hoeflea sp. TYP-13]|uniref:hypothetical protein n=1 Tax=Hoeflea sp. TYP-13 TaxID=3230023 RepID=UPI0034C5CC65